MLSNTVHAEIDFLAHPLVLNERVLTDNWFHGI